MVGSVRFWRGDHVAAMSAAIGDALAFDGVHLAAGAPAVQAARGTVKLYRHQLEQEADGGTPDLPLYVIGAFSHVPAGCLLVRSGKAHEAAIVVGGHLEDICGRIHGALYKVRQVATLEASITRLVREGRSYCILLGVVAINATPTGVLIQVYPDATADGCDVGHSTGGTEEESRSCEQISTDLLPTALFPSLAKAGGMAAAPPDGPKDCLPAIHLLHSIKDLFF